MARLIMTGTNRDGSTRQVTGVLVNPSAGSWVAIITDENGKNVFSAKGADATAFYAPIKDTWEGVNVTTATNITQITIYTD